MLNPELVTIYRSAFQDTAKTLNQRPDVWAEAHEASLTAERGTRAVTFRLAEMTDGTPGIEVTESYDGWDGEHESVVLWTQNRDRTTFPKHYSRPMKMRPDTLGTVLAWFNELLERDSPSRPYEHVAKGRKGDVVPGTRMVPMTPGAPLTKGEAEHVERTLLDLMRENLPNGGVFNIETPKFLSCLGWTQKRHPDVRDHLENPSTQRRLSKTVDLAEPVFVSRGQLSVHVRAR